MKAQELDIRFYASGLGSIHSSQAHTFIISAKPYPFPCSRYCKAVWVDPKRHD